jgi:arsenate reductase-like glutaredoxin family protein
MAEEIEFYAKSTCTKCQKARSFLQERGVPLKERDLIQNPLTVQELDRLIGDRPIAQFLHPGSELYQQRKMGENPPTREEAIRLMAEDPNLILRPLVRSGELLLARPDEDTLGELAG